MGVLVIASLSSRLWRTVMDMGLRKKVAVLFIGMLVVAALNLGLLHRMLQDFNGVAATATVAGKLRMLGQKLAFETLSISNGLSKAYETLEHDIIDFEAAYLVLRSGGTAFNEFVRPLDTSHGPSLDAVWLAWRDYRDHIRELVASSRHSDSAEITTLQRSLSEVSGQLLSRTDVLIQRLVQRAQETQSTALEHMYLLLGFNALVLFLTYLAVSGHVVEPIQRLASYCRQLAKGNYDTRIDHPHGDEIGQLAQALNQSAGTIGKLLRAIAHERKELQRTSAMFHGVARNAVTGVFVIDGDMRFRYVNTKLAEMFGYLPEEMSNALSVEDLLISPDSDGWWHQLAGHTRQRDTPLHYETQVRHRDGTPLDIEVFASRMVLDGAPAVIGIVLNVTERKQAEASLRRAALVYANTSEAVVVTDADGIILDINPAFTEITGYSPDEALGRPMSLLSSGFHGRDFYNAMWRSLHETGKWSGDIRNRRKDGSEYVERLTIDTSYNENGTVNCHIGLFSDVTAERHKEETIWRQAHYDHLTGLSNRKMFHEELERAMEEAASTGGSMALIYMDLDYFKEVNDSLGHDVGDELLQEVAGRLRRAVRERDLVARLGGDEFTLILHNASQRAHVDEVCRRVLASVSEPYLFGQHSISVSASLGVTFYPHDGSTITELMQNADLAMYSAKDAGRNQFRHFTPALQQQAQNRRELMRELQHAVSQQEFELYYQPVVELATGCICKAEALIRWHHPQRGLVSPADFIPLAEDSGLIVPIGDWVFRSVAAQLARWRKTLRTDFQVSVNVSPAQFMSEELDPAAWLACVTRQGLPVSAVLIEITERVLLKADSAAKNKLLAFRDAGVQLALDDFGTGYSSMAYLKRFDIDYIKIDQMFVRNITSDADDLALCQAMIAMAHRLGLKVVAEGVETEAQHALLIEAGCDYAQGFLYAPPVPTAEFEALLEHGRPQPALID